MNQSILLLLLATITQAHGGVVEIPVEISNSTVSTSDSVLSPLTPWAAVGMTFFSMAATIIGASIPVLVGLYKNRSFKSIPSDQTLTANASPTLPPMFTAGCLGLAGGALLFGTLFHVLPDSVQYFSTLPSVGKDFATLTSLATFALGIIFFILLEKLLIWMAPDLSCPCHSKKACDCEKPESCGCAMKAENTKIKSTSWLTFLAMTIHHLPEGLVFFVSATTDLKAGAILGLILLIHVFPEGLAMGATAYEAYPSQKWRGPLYGAVAGFAQPLGALIGLIAFNGKTPSAGVLGGVGGVTAGMLFTIATRGLLPYARTLDKHDKVVTYSLFGGAFIIFFSIAMFSVAGYDA